MSPEEFNLAASRLCVTCGICCDGTLFHIVRMQPSDSVGALNVLGLKLKKKKGQNCIEQPCPMLKQQQCSIYAGRPERCRLFECELLKRLANESITEANAAITITEARRQVTEILDLIEKCGHHNKRQPLTIRYDRVMAQPVSEDWDPSEVKKREELKVRMRVLQSLLAETFRPPPQPPTAES